MVGFLKHEKRKKPLPDHWKFRLALVSPLVVPIVATLLGCFLWPQNAGRIVMEVGNVCQVVALSIAFFELSKLDKILGGPGLWVRLRKQKLQISALPAVSDASFVSPGCARIGQGDHTPEHRVEQLEEDIEKLFTRMMEERRHRQAELETARRSIDRKVTEEIGDLKTRIQLTTGVTDPWAYTLVLLALVGVGLVGAADFL